MDTAQPATERRPDVSVSLSPPFIEKLARASSHVSDTIALTNSSLYPVDVTIDFADFRVNDRGEIEEMPPGTDAASLSPYLHVAPLTLHVSAQARAFFRYTVDTPADFQQLREDIFFSSTPAIPKQPNQVLFVPRMGIPLYVENVTAKPAHIRVDSVKWSRSSGDTLRLALLLVNEGERNIRPKGFVEVRSADGKFNQTFPFNQGNEPLLPGQKRGWPLSFAPVPSGDLSVRLQFETSPRTTFDQQYRVAGF